MQRTRSQAGFSLVEILIVIAISALLSTIAITSSRIGQNQVALSVEAAKISGLMLQAKELSISTYAAAGASCGYGLVFDFAQQTYSLFSYSPAGAPPCPGPTTITTLDPATIRQYAGQTWQVHVAKGVVISSASPTGDVLSAVMFYPPQPATLIARAPGVNFLNPALTSKVYLKTSDGSASAVISVNPAGQVEF